MIKAIKKLNRLLDKQQKKKIAVLFIIMLIGAMLETMSVSMLVPLATVMVGEEQMTQNVYIAKLCAFLNISSYRAFVATCTVIIIILYIFKNLFSIFQNYL